MKRLAQRLGVRDSDIVRFALKTMLTRLVPLCDPDVRGRNLVPVFVESGAELLRYFDLDAARLDAIINDSTGSERRVEREDIALLALTGAQDPYAALKLSELNHQDEHAAALRRAVELAAPLPLREIRLPLQWFKAVRSSHRCAFRSPGVVHEYPGSTPRSLVSADRGGRS